MAQHVDERCQCSAWFNAGPRNRGSAASSYCDVEPGGLAGGIVLDVGPGAAAKKTVARGREASDAAVSAWLA